MQVRWGRLVVGSVIAELTVIALLAVVVVIIGPHAPLADQVFAQNLGRWVGPIGGALVTFLGTLVIARPLSTDQVAHGLLLGGLLALLDITILVASRAPFEWIFVVSNLGKIVAGYLGAVIAGPLKSRRLRQ